MNTVGIRQLKANASKILEDVETHRERYAVTRRGKPVAMIVPAPKGFVDLLAEPEGEAIGDLATETGPVGDEIRRGLARVRSADEQSAWDPQQERDALIKRHITRDPQTGKIVFRARPYPVGTVVQNLLATGFDYALVGHSFSDLPAEALAAAERFWQLHPLEILRYLRKYLP